MGLQVLAPPAVASAAPRLRSQRARRLRVFGSNRVAVLGVVLGVLVVIAAVGAPVIGSLDPFDQSAANRLSGPDAVHLMGRDTFGRDIFARVLHAGRVSLAVGVGSVALGGTLGTLLGLVAGYGGRRVETVLMRAVDMLMVFPSLLLGLIVLAVLGAGLEKMIVAIGIVLAPAFARLVHGATLSLKEREFVEAARCLGASHSRIVGRHILPNVVGETVVLASLLTASAIRIEASLSFIGLGVSPPTPTWGNMIRDGLPVLLNAPWLSIFPGLAILVSVLAFNLVGDGVRDVLDPRARQ
jgi:peptide/nickel transport system permease protein